MLTSTHELFKTYQSIKRPYELDDLEEPELAITVRKRIQISPIEFTEFPLRQTAMLPLPDIPPVDQSMVLPSVEDLLEKDQVLKWRGEGENLKGQLRCLILYSD